MKKRRFNAVLRVIFECLAEAKAQKEAACGGF
jgi:hypothetical protein